MSEFSLSSTTTKKKTNISSLLLTDFSLCFYFLLSHPLYFISFVFLSPYVYKLLSFLSPLFITTSILILALIVHNSSFDLPESEVSLVLYIYKGVVSKFTSNLSVTLDGCIELDDLEVYKIVFETSSHELSNTPKGEDGVGDIDQSSIGDGEAHVITEVKTLRGFLHEKEEGVEVKALSAETDKVVEEQKVETISRGSKAKEAKIINNGGQSNSFGRIESFNLNRQFSKHFDNDERKWETISMSVESKAKWDYKEAKILNNGGQSNLSDSIELCNLSSSKHLNNGEDKVETTSMRGGSKAKWGCKEAKIVNNGGQPDLSDRTKSCNLSRQSSKHSDNDEGFSTPKSVAKWDHKETKVIAHDSQSNLSDLIKSCNLSRQFSKHSDNDEGFSTPKSVENSPPFGSNCLGTFGSMRKEKEWRKTLACKLFEERHSGNESQDMDMLWETHETESMKQQSKSKKARNGHRGSYGEDEGEEESDDSDGDRQLCCLQALKFSATKMNLGMRRPNLVKISKAIKGIGWLHHVGKHGKKSNH